MILIWCFDRDWFSSVKLTCKALISSFKAFISFSPLCFSNICLVFWQMWKTKQKLRLFVMFLFFISAYPLLKKPLLHAFSEKCKAPLSTLSSWREWSFSSCCKMKSNRMNVATWRTDRQTGRQTDMQTDRQTDRQADMQTDRQADRHADRQICRQTDMQTDID